MVKEKLNRCIEQAARAVLRVSCDVRVEWRKKGDVERALNGEEVNIRVYIVCKKEKKVYDGNLKIEGKELKLNLSRLESFNITYSIPQ